MNENQVRVRLDTTILDKLISAFKNGVPRVKVGVLSMNSQRKEGGPTNAAVGAAHEFGTDKLPARSFLRMPLREFLLDDLEGSGLLKEETIKQVAEYGSARIIAERMGMVAVNIVINAFRTGGFGQWIPSKKLNGEVTGIGQTLRDTDQLMKSISYEVKK